MAPKAISATDTCRDAVGGETTPSSHSCSEGPGPRAWEPEEERCRLVSNRDPVIAGERR